MNRLVIIGNGFDLAHGLPTSYKHFIVDYWENVIQESKNKDVYEDDLFSLKLNKSSIGSQGSYELLNDVKCYKTLKIFTIRSGKYCTQMFKNNFFLDLSDITNIENWVDIENLYYKKLKIITKSDSLTIEQKKTRIIILNEEFEQVKNLLEQYLKEKVEEQYDFRLHRDNPIRDLLLPEFINRFDENRYLKEFRSGDHLYVREFLEKHGEKYDLTTCFLSFNYTKVVEQYYNTFTYPKQINYIHGKLNTSVNKVNFGFGDEMDDDYKLIENIDDNEYLKNFKSFQYLQNSNYKNLLDFVESDRKFQVYIMGHSCGLSDRTMLNTIFEHPNCISIKVFYHQKKDGTDNYTEIIQNISRHFNKKKLMREKIVNKTLCESLPQIQLPLK
jgi:hypothetical protein